MRSDVCVPDAAAPFAWRLSWAKLLYAFVFLVLPLFDVINGYLVLNGLMSDASVASPSQLGRLIALTMILFLIRDRRLTYPFILLACYPLGIEFVATFWHQNLIGTLYGLVVASKLIYLVLLTTLLTAYIRSERDFILLAEYLRFGLLLVATLLFTSLIFGLGKSTYGAGFGTKGYFSSGNGLGIYLGTMTAFLICTRHRGLLHTGSPTILYVIAATMAIGSKTALLLGLINCLLLIVSMRSRWILLFFIATGAYFFVGPIVDAARTVFDVIFRRFDNAQNFVFFLASGRLDYVLDAWHTLKDQDVGIWRLLFGMGAFVSYQSPLSVKAFDTLETDLFDLLFMYGAVAVFIYLAAFLFSLFALRRSGVFILPLAMLFLHSILAGHVVFNGMSVHAMAVALACIGFLASSKPSETT